MQIEDILIVNPNHRIASPQSALSVGSHLSKVKGFDVGFVDAGTVGNEEALNEIRHCAAKEPLIRLTCMPYYVPIVKAAALVFFAFNHREASLAEALTAFKHDVVFVLLDVTALEEHVKLDCRLLLDNRAAFR